MRTFFAFLVVLMTALPLRAEESKLKLLAAPVYHILPETHNNESGYFALCEGLNGKIYVGTAKYGENAYLVEFDPATKKQRIVVDVNAVTGATGKGYASQSKIHSRNFVGPSGKIYMGSKQGYPLPDETKDNDIPPYAGGFVLVYDPKTDKTENLGIPYPGQGVIDVVADEGRGLMYVVTCEDQYWMLRDERHPDKGYRWLGPNLTHYATTLIDAGGRAHAITKEFQLATFDPQTRQLALRDILVDGAKWTRPTTNSIPTWQLAPDGKSAYLILLDSPKLLRIDLPASVDPAEKATGEVLGKFVETDKPTDCRNGLDVGADGKLYASIQTPHATAEGVGGGGSLVHVYRFDPATKQAEDLGALAVKNPDFFAFTGPDGKAPPWSHGMHKLPSGELTPTYGQMSQLVTRDNTVYVISLAPFTLWQITDFKIAPK